MTSEIEALKTNEFLRRRKLRLQQVREQSKEIAKHIRQRANVEGLQNIDGNNAEALLECQRQEKLVRQLELLYAEGVTQVGAGHSQASQVTLSDAPVKVDLSKLRAKEAAAKLRERKQRLLDEKKKLLDRKLHARETANEISREKTKCLQPKPSDNLKEKNPPSETTVPESSVKKKPKETGDNQILGGGDAEPVIATKSDMATQWTYDPLPNEWDPAVPTLVLLEDDIGSTNEPLAAGLQQPTGKKLDLFACSDEMPTSLRPMTPSAPAPLDPAAKTSLTLVSEYLQHRNLNLRGQSSTRPSRKCDDDLQSIRQTILRTRASKTSGNSVCRVLDEQLIPVPSWHAEFCAFCTQNHTPSMPNCKSMVNKIVQSVKKVNQEYTPTPVLTGSSPFRRTRAPWLQGRNAGKTDKSPNFRGQDIGNVNRVPPVTVYDHSTRDTQHLPTKQFVSRDSTPDQDADAYSQAMKESSTSEVTKTAIVNNIAQERRNKIAMTKQNVEKEYKDTMTFLNSLDREKPPKSTKIAFMDERRQQKMNENHERKMQHEFQKIERECRPECFVSSGHTSRAKTRAKCNNNLEDEEFEERDLEYTWMPVPERDAALAVHALPTSPHPARPPRDPRGRGVQFSRVDSYHEYRTRHKHTPPTRDTSDTPPPHINNVTIEDDDSECSHTSVTSSVEDKSASDKRNTEAEGIIIYKIIDGKGKSKTMKMDKDVAEILSSCKKKCKAKPKQKSQGSAALSMQQISEGVYRTVSEKGGNIDFCVNHAETTVDRNNQAPRQVPEQMQWKVAADAPMKPSERLQERKLCTCGCVTVEETASTSHSRELAGAPSLASIASCETATPTAPNPDTVQQNPVLIKPKASEGQEASNFYIGASGLLHNEDYEVIIQLRKKSMGKENKDVKDDGVTEKSEMNEQKDTQADVVKIGDNNKSINASENTKIHTSHNKEINDNLKGMLQSETGKLYDEADKGFKLVDTSETVQSKSVSCFIDSNAKAPSPVARQGSLEVALKPSISTQTSFMESNSPAARPVFLHMTSSTSTTYMSPPDRVLPDCLKDTKRREHKKHSEKKSRKCKHSKKENEERIDISGDWVKHVGKIYRHTETPPNTRRSGSIESASGKCQEQVKKENKNTKPFNKPKRQVVARCSVNKNQSLIQNKKKASKSKLNPVIRNYVNKLLTLSKEGLKAIEVVNQDCSSVTTPSSSIINVACNRDRRKSPVNMKISLEQVKEILTNNIVNNMNNKNSRNRVAKYVVNKKKETIKIKSSKKTRTHRPNSPFSNITKQNQNHAIPELNPSQQPSVTNTHECDTRSSSENKHKQSSSTIKNSSSTGESAPTAPKSTPMSNYTSTDETTSTVNSKAKSITLKSKSTHRAPEHSKYSPVPNSTDTSSSTHTHHQHSDNIEYKKRNSSKRLTSHDPMNTSIQTGHSIESDTNFIKMTETKLQNIEKIANLTEVCTRRLSNLAKVLEKVRENKSNVYSHIPTSSSSSDEQISHKNVMLKSSSASEITENAITAENEKSVHETSVTCPQTKADEEDNKRFVGLLQGIPKPTAPSTAGDKHDTDKFTFEIKYRGKPPTALSRIHLKHAQEDIIPHELSTVIEVDSPLSSKVRSKNLLHENKSNTPSLHSSNESINDLKQKNIHSKALDNVPLTTSTTNSVNPDLLQTNKKLLKDSNKNTPNNNTAAKVEMMDLKKFNEIMLKPFVSIEEFAKQCNVGVFDDASNMDDLAKDTIVNDDLSSLHSEGSLPDVIGELLKRNLISKPFEYESVSNLNSTTISTESSFSALTLSQIKREKKKGSVMFSNKENISETSDSLSMSSNPDLENAFKKLGMGWASSTLRKTKERLALSSSSNTSSLSNSHKFKPLHVDKHNLSSSNLNVTKKPARTSHDHSKSVQQQTSQLTSMTVKEFLDKELADKITFSKSYRNETEPEFISLYETKLPDELKNSSNIVREERSIDSVSNANRARTSTPVQLYKSAAYHSSSSSNNNTNGLFGNVDDLSSVKVTSGSARNHSTSDKDDLTIPNYSLRIRREASDKSKSD